MGLLDSKRVLLGVGGGIAAYKAPELVRRLRDAGASVRVMLTSAGARFVSELALEVVSEAPVGRELWSVDGDSRIVHTDIGAQVDLIMLAPATANLIGRIRHGLADDLLTTTVMASRTPVMVCPSMNTDMLENPLVRANIDALAALPRYTIVEPGSGLLACGVTGPGRLPDPPELIEAAHAILTPDTLTGVRVVVSAGPTREALDPVRFLGNRSTGTMGFALARALAARGAVVTLVAGPVALPTPAGVHRRVDVESAAEMAAAVEQLWDAADVLVMAAAVADYRPGAVAEGKLKKQSGGLSLELERTEDILARASARPGRDARVLVGFAAETSDAAERGAAKLRAKGLDWIVANRVGEPGTGFGTGDNEGVLLGRGGESIPLARADKQDFAERIADAIAPSIAAARERFHRA